MGNHLPIDDYRIDYHTQNTLDKYQCLWDTLTNQYLDFKCLFDRTLHQVGIIRIFRFYPDVQLLVKIRASLKYFLSNSEIKQAMLFDQQGNFMALINVSNALFRIEQLEIDLARIRVIFLSTKSLYLTTAPEHIRTYYKYRVKSDSNAHLCKAKINFLPRLEISMLTPEKAKNLLLNQKQQITFKNNQVSSKENVTINKSSEEYLFEFENLEKWSDDDDEEESWSEWSSDIENPYDKS